MTYTVLNISCYFGFKILIKLRLNSQKIKTLLLWLKQAINKAICIDLATFWHRDVSWELKAIALLPGTEHAQLELCGIDTRQDLGHNCDMVYIWQLKHQTIREMCCVLTSLKQCYHWNLHGKPVQYPKSGPILANTAIKCSPKNYGSQMVTLPWVTVGIQWFWSQVSARIQEVFEIQGGDIWGWGSDSWQ